MSCNCEGKNYNISMGCCEPVLAPIENYYTKYQIDKMIASAVTSGCCITPEEVDEKIEEAISGISVSGVTEEELNNAIASAKTEIEAEIPTVPTSNTAFTNDAGYLTEHQSLTAYSTTNEVNELINQSVSGKADSSTVSALTNTVTAHTASTSVHVTSTEKNTWNSKVDSSTLNNYLLKSKIWCGTESEYNSIVNKDSETLYLIHE